MPNDGGWILPEVIDPERICIQIHVPNEQAHIAAFFGALLDLTRWFNWQRDEDHTAVPVSSVWFDIWTQANDAYNAGEYCEVPTQVRLKPGDDCELQTSTDGITWIDVADLSLCATSVFNEQFPPTNPPAPGQPGPQPGGGSPLPAECWPLSFKVDTQAATLIPLPVASGWTITPTELSGATTDGRFGPVNQWHCASGGLFAAGTCGGTTFTDPNDPDPTAPHQCLLLSYPDGTFVQLAVGVPIVIPTGMAAGLYQLIINTNTVSLPPAISPWTAGGDLTVKLNICNSGWCHKFDFAGTADGWTILNGTQESDGIGSVFYDSANASLVYISITPPTPMHLTRVVFTAIRPAGSGLNNLDRLATNFGIFGSYSSATGNPVVVTRDGAADNPTALNFSLGTGNTSAPDLKLISLILYGSDTINPFGSTNC